MVGASRVEVVEAAGAELSATTAQRSGVPGSSPEENPYEVGFCASRMAFVWLSVRDRSVSDSIRTDSLLLRVTPHPEVSYVMVRPSVENWQCPTATIERRVRSLEHSSSPKLVMSY